MKLAEFSITDGPIASNLDEVLKQMGVQRHAYHGKAFIGTHVHKCLKVLKVIQFHILHFW